jgi:pyridoxal phosphate enzyme (YggS family)
MSGVRTVLERNLGAVRQQIASAARASGREPASVKLVAVTKYVPPPIVRELVMLGCRILGESRPQELWAKAEALADLPIEWHLVGHLQRNKIRRTLPVVTLLHSIDSERLLDALNAEATAERPVRGLLEVNVSGDRAKHGFAPTQLDAFIARLDQFSNVQITGLMCMAGLESTPVEAEREFAQLRELQESLAPSCPAGHALSELSMGMSGDFELAIRQGATMVRLGSALFEGLEP